MKKILLIILILLSSITSLFSSIFSSYDISLYTTPINYSLSKTDDGKIGFDYTANAFLLDMTSGLYFRFGARSPYSTLLQPFVKNSDVVNAEYSLIFGAGPALRRFVSTTLSWYMTTGLSFLMDKVSREDAFLKTEETENLFSIDFDSGFRLTLSNHFSLRIGLAFSYPIISFSSVTINDEEMDSSAFNQYLFLDTGSESPIKISGYIILGRAYTSWQKKNTYRYVITQDGKYLEIMN